MVAQDVLVRAKAGPLPSSSPLLQASTIDGIRWQQLARWLKRDPAMNASIGGSSGVARLNLQQPSELPEHLKASYSTSSIILHPLRPSLETEHPQPVGDAACLAQS